MQSVEKFLVIHSICRQRIPLRPHSRSVKPEGLQKLRVNGSIFGLSDGMAVGLTRIRKRSILWAGLKGTEGKT